MLANVRINRLKPLFLRINSQKLEINNRFGKGWRFEFGSGKMRTILQIKSLKCVREREGCYKPSSERSVRESPQWERVL